MTSTKPLSATRRSVLAAALAALSALACAQTPAPDAGANAKAAPVAAARSNPASALAASPSGQLPNDLRGQLETIGRYAAEVGRRTQGGEARPVSRQVDLSGDPFEVTPQLRAGRNRSPFTGLPGASVLELKRRVQLRAVLRSAQGAVAQLLINEKDVITIMDKELIDLGELGTFQVEIQSATVSLLDPNNRQGKKVVLR